ncbi:hypothetical protein BX666DRAFT_1866191 [Dichotomocladium elegans]|nr:hypothetical protein BX666DRAFT_1866191 [Dichotomocladium elegans]
MIYARRISQSFLRRSMRREGARLSKLRSERSLQLGELKNKLTYNSTLALIERYDSETANQIKTAAAAASSRSAAADGSSRTPPQRVAPVMHPPPQRTEPPQELLSSRSDKPKTPLLQLLWWYSKLIDTLVGENESPENQYALICRHCYAHNGLYPREEIHRIRELVEVFSCVYVRTGTLMKQHGR